MDQEHDWNRPGVVILGDIRRPQVQGCEPQRHGPRILLRSLVVPPEPLDHPPQLGGHQGQYGIPQDAPGPRLEGRSRRVLDTRRRASFRPIQRSNRERLGDRTFPHVGKRGTTARRGKGTSLNSTCLTPRPLALSVYVHGPEAHSPRERSISVTSLFYSTCPFFPSPPQTDALDDDREHAIIARRTAPR